MLTKYFITLTYASRGFVFSEYVVFFDFFIYFFFYFIYLSV